jgi:hypothetical protein
MHPLPHRELTVAVQAQRWFLATDDFARFADWMIETMDHPDPVLFDLSTPKSLSAAQLTELLTRLPTSGYNPALALELDYALGFRTLKGALVCRVGSLDVGTGRGA